MNRETPLFGTSGVRRLADASLIQLGVKLGLALGTIRKRIVIAGDTRTSSPALKQATTGGLLAAGATVYDAGTAPTPTVALAAVGFDAGVMITASHNPPQYNGIKVLDPDGCSLSRRDCDRLDLMVRSDSLSASPWEEMGRADFYEKAVEKHLAKIESRFPRGVRAKVVVDCGGGAACLVTPRLLRRLGCEVTELNCIPTGSFPREVEPTETSLAGLMDAVRESGADLGIAHDGDADRMMAVDDRGSFISGDMMLALFAGDIGARSVVTTVDASMAIEEMGITVKRTPVGDTYVSEELRRSGGDFGGEPCGAWVFPGISLCADGIYAAARVAAMASRGKLSERIAMVPRFPLRRFSVPRNGWGMGELIARLSRMKPVSVDTIDGARFDFLDGWLLVRPSGTEPKLRFTVEARTIERVSQLQAACLGIVMATSR